MARHFLPQLEVVIYESLFISFFPMIFYLIAEALISVFSLMSGTYFADISSLLDQFSLSFYSGL